MYTARMDTVGIVLLAPGLLAAGNAGCTVPQGFVTLGGVSLQGTARTAVLALVPGSVGSGGLALWLIACVAAEAGVAMGVVVAACAVAAGLAGPVPYTLQTSASSLGLGGAHTLQRLAKHTADHWTSSIGFCVLPSLSQSRRQCTLRLLLLAMRYPFRARAALGCAPSSVWCAGRRCGVGGSVTRSGVSPPWLWCAAESLVPGGAVNAMHVLQSCPTGNPTSATASTRFVLRVSCQHPRLACTLPAVRAVRAVTGESFQHTRETVRHAATLISNLRFVGKGRFYLCCVRARVRARVCVQWCTWCRRLPMHAVLCGPLSGSLVPGAGLN